jgi:hypothetical protein
MSDQYVGIEVLNESLVEVNKQLKNAVKTLERMFIQDKREDFLAKEKAEDAQEVAETAGTVAPPTVPTDDLMPPPPPIMSTIGRPSVRGSDLPTDGTTYKMKEGGVVGTNPILPGLGAPSGKQPGVKHKSLEQTGFDDTFEKNISTKLEDDYDLDPRMKSGFGDVMAQPARAAAAALVDLLSRFPAQSEKQAATISDNIDYISKTYNLNKVKFDKETQKENNISRVFNSLKEGTQTFFSNLRTSTLNLFRSKEEQLEEKLKDKTSDEKAEGKGGQGPGPVLGRGGNASASPTATNSGMDLGMSSLTRMISSSTNSTQTTTDKSVTNLLNTFMRNGDSSSLMKAFYVSDQSNSIFNSYSGGDASSIFSQSNVTTQRLDFPTTNLTELTDTVIQENRMLMDEQSSITAEDFVMPAVSQATPASSYMDTDSPLGKEDTKVSPYFEVYASTSQFG